MQTPPPQVIVRFYSDHLMRTIDADVLIEILLKNVPDVERISIEKMSAHERAEAGVIDENQIVCVRHRCFIYEETGDHLRRLPELEREVELSNP